MPISEETYRRELESSGDSRDAASRAAEEYMRETGQDEAADREAERRRKRQEQERDWANHEAGETVFIYAGQTEDIVADEGTSAIEGITAGGSIGGALGTAIPGLGNVAGTIIGGAAGAVGSLFSGPDEKSVSGFIETMLLEIFPDAHRSEDGKHVVLPGEYEPAAVLELIRQLATEMQKNLSGDDASDVGKWIEGLDTTERPSVHDKVCEFKVGKPVTVKTQTNGMQPMQAGIGLAAIVVLLGVVFGKSG